MPPLPKFYHSPVGHKGQGWCLHSTVWKTEAQQGAPCLQVWASSSIPYIFPSE